MPPQSERCTFGAPAPPRALEMALEGKKLFPKKSLVLRALAVQPPSEYDIDSSTPSDTMCSALAALSSLVFDIQAQHTHSLRHLFFTENEKEWKLISRWLSFFVETCLRKHATSWDGWDFQEHVLYIVPLIFVGPGHCHRNLGREARALIEKNPEIFRMVFQAWSFAVTSFHRSLSLHTRAVLLFMKVADEEDTADNLFMRTFLEVSPDPVTVCMSFFTEHVSRRMPGIALRALSFIALFVHRMAREPSPKPLFHSLFKAGALKPAMLTLRRISALEVARGISEFDKPTYFSCIARLHGFIVCAVNHKALPAVAEAFDLGWLKLLHGAAWFIEREIELLHQPFINGMICEFLTGALIHLFSFPSILRPFVKYTNRILADDPKAFDFTDKPRLSRFGAAWKEAIKKAAHFNGLRQNYKMMTVICANSKCTTTPDQYHFVQVCSRCRSNVYCSYECQKTDWNDGHREACRGNDLVRTPLLSSLSPHGNTYDATFFQFTVNKSLQKHRKSLLSSVLDFFENNVCGCGQKLSTIVLHLRFFSLYADPSELVGHCGRGLAEDSHMEWNFRCMNNAPAKFVNPVGRGSEKEYLELGEVMYHADFPEYCLSGVFDLLGP